MTRPLSAGDLAADLFGHEHLARPIRGGDLVRLAPRAQHDLHRRAETVWQWGKAGPRGGGNRVLLQAGRCSAGLWWSCYSYDLWGSGWGECGGGSPFVHPSPDRAGSVARTAADLLRALSGAGRITPRRARALELEWRPALEALGAVSSAVPRVLTTPPADQHGQAVGRQRQRRTDRHARHERAAEGVPAERAAGCHGDGQQLDGQRDAGAGDGRHAARSAACAGDAGGQDQDGVGR